MSDQRLSATFEELALPLLDQLYNFAHWLTQNRSEADDLVQETYAKALRGFTSFQQGTNFRAWMFRILKNSFLNTKAGLKAETVFDENEHEDLVQDTSTPESVLIDKANRQVVHQSLAELPLRFREILILCEVEEMSYQDIATTLSIAPGTVMSRLHRARKALRALLQQKLKGVEHGLR